jgi:hypothetical protein
VGSLVAGYRVEQEVARGGMAMVYRASDERLGRVVALKLMAADLAADAEFRARFLRECRAAAMVEDPHIIPVYGAGEADGVLFIAMRFVSGGDVSSLIRQAGPLPAVRVAGIVSPVASALDSLHQAGLVHRDVQPANMLLDTRPGRPDHVYLSDFGLTKGASSVTRLTGTGQFLGTLDYVSPEQIGGRELDGRTDQYSLACAAFELLTGAPPFRRGNLAAAVGAHLIEPPPLVTAVRPDLPPAVDEVLARALAKQSDSRYPTCGDFADALRDALGVARYDAGQDVSPARPAEAAAKNAGATANGGPPAAIPDSPQTPASPPALATPARLTASAGPPPVARRALPPARVPGRRVRRLRALAVIGVALLAAGGGLAILLASSLTGGRTPATTGSSAGKRTPVRPAPARLVVQAMAAPGNSELSDVSAGPHGTAWAVGYSTAPTARTPVMHPRPLSCTGTAPHGPACPAPARTRLQWTTSARRQAEQPGQSAPSVPCPASRATRSSSAGTAPPGRGSPAP